MSEIEKLKYELNAIRVLATNAQKKSHGLTLRAQRLSSSYLAAVARYQIAISEEIK